MPLTSSSTEIKNEALLKAMQEVFLNFYHETTSATVERDLKAINYVKGWEKPSGSERSVLVKQDAVMSKLQSFEDISEEDKQKAFNELKMATEDDFITIFVEQNIMEWFKELCKNYGFVDANTEDWGPQKRLQDFLPMNLYQKDAGISSEIAKEEEIVDSTHSTVISYFNSHTQISAFQRLEKKLLKAYREARARYGRELELAARSASSTSSTSTTVSSSMPSSVTPKPGHVRNMSRLFGDQIIKGISLGTPISASLSAISSGKSRPASEEKTKITTKSEIKKIAPPALPDNRRKPGPADQRHSISQGQSSVSLLSLSQDKKSELVTRTISNIEFQALYTLCERFGDNYSLMKAVVAGPISQLQYAFQFFGLEVKSIKKLEKDGFNISVTKDKLNINWIEIGKLIDQFIEKNGQSTEMEVALELKNVLLEKDLDAIGTLLRFKMLSVESIRRISDMKLIRQQKIDVPFFSMIQEVYKLLCPQPITALSSSSTPPSFTREIKNQGPPPLPDNRRRPGPADQRHSISQSQSSVILLPLVQDKKNELITRNISENEVDNLLKLCVSMGYANKLEEAKATGESNQLLCALQCIGLNVKSIKCVDKGCDVYMTKNELNIKWDEIERLINQYIRENSEDKDKDLRQKAFEIRNTISKKAADPIGALLLYKTASAKSRWDIAEMEKFGIVELSSPFLNMIREVDRLINGQSMTTSSSSSSSSSSSTQSTASMQF